jgi:hypothetical protein
MPVLTVRISEAEKAGITKRAKQSGMTTGALVRQLMNQQPVDTAAELLRELDEHMGNTALRSRESK